jgi:hypothetical protein
MSFILLHFSLCSFIHPHVLIHVLCSPHFCALKCDADKEHPHQAVINKEEESANDVSACKKRLRFRAQPSTSGCLLTRRKSQLMMYLLVKKVF